MSVALKLIRRNACDGLKAKDVIAEIAVACGYGSANALRKVFAAETGKNPLAWRKRAE